MSFPLSTISVSSASFTPAPPGPQSRTSNIPLTTGFKRDRDNENNDDNYSNSEMPAYLNSYTIVDTPSFKKQTTTEETTSLNEFGALKENDPVKIANRMKQIQFGKNTIGYDNYIAEVPRNRRGQDRNEHPRTPDPYVKQSKRAFDGRMHQWRRNLHTWDSKDVGTFTRSLSNGSDTFDDIIKKNLLIKSKSNNIFSNNEKKHNIIQMETTDVDKIILNNELFEEKSRVDNSDVELKVHEEKQKQQQQYQQQQQEIEVEDDNNDIFDDNDDDDDDDVL